MTTCHTRNTSANKLDMALGQRFLWRRTSITSAGRVLVDCAPTHPAAPSHRSGTCGAEAYGLFHSATPDLKRLSPYLLGNACLYTRVVPSIPGVPDCQTLRAAAHLSLGSPQTTSAHQLPLDLRLPWWPSEGEEKIAEFFLTVGRKTAPKQFEAPSKSMPDRVQAVIEAKGWYTRY